MVALEAGRGALLADVGFGDPVQLQQADAGPRGAGGDAQGIGCQSAGFPELVDLLLALVADLFADQGGALLPNSLTGRMSAWFDLRRSQ